MRGVPIKFRGITVKYKEVVYGYLFHCGNKAFIMSLVFYTAGEWETQTDEVDPDSVAQLIGFDIDGNEVYEGDTLVRNPIEQSPIPLQFALGYLGEPKKIKTIAKMHPSIECKFYTLERGGLNQ